MSYRQDILGQIRYRVTTDGQLRQCQQWVLGLPALIA